MEVQTDRSHSLTTTRLYDAALKGDVHSLLNLLQEDQFVLDQYTAIAKSSYFMQSPLHIAANLGHLDFTQKILEQKPELAEEVDNLKKSSPLHIASAKGHWQIVQTLIAAKPNMCFVRDRDGWTPVHVAAVNGQVNVLQVLLQYNPLVARERTKAGETVLHLCIKHKQDKSLQLLLDLTDDSELLNSKDSDGNTVLHLAVAGKQPQMVKLLLEHTKIDKNAVNNNDLTALDSHILLAGSLKKDDKINLGLINWDNNDQIGPSLEEARVLKAKHVLEIRNTHSWVEEQRNALMVVASLIATMAFQVGISPPGGFWQDNKLANKATVFPGVSILQDEAPEMYHQLLVWNTIALVSSLSVILLLISGLPCKKLFVGILRVTMWTAVTATTMTYIMSSNGIIDYWENHKTILYTLVSWLCLMGFLLFVHALFFLVKFIIRRKSLRSRIVNLVDSLQDTSSPASTCLKSHA